MRNLLLTTAAIMVSVFTIAPANAATDILLNSGLYLSGVDMKPVLKITTDDSGHSLQIEGPHVPATTLSLSDNHNFDTTTALDSGVVSRDFVRKCAVRAGRQKPCFKGLYDEASGKLRIQEGDEFTVTARLLVLSSDSVLQMQWTTWTRNDAMVAQKFSKQVLKWSAPAKTSAGSSMPVPPAKDPIAL